MRLPTFSFWIAGGIALLFTISSAAAAEDDERILRDAGLANECPALLAFFHARARMDVDGEQLRQLLNHLAAGNEAQQGAAKSQLLGFGALALPALRQAANDLDHPQAAARAAGCLPWLEGLASHKLLIAAANLLAQRRPEGAAAALLAYLPFADNPDVIAAIDTALAAVAAPKGKPDPALLRGLSDRQSARRAAAGVALCRAVSPQQAPDVRKLLKDPAATVRLRAAKALAEANDAESIPVLIDLLAELPAAERESVEELLKQLAGEWAPILQFARDDELSRKVRRDAWASWWRHSDGSMLLAAIGKHTLTSDNRRKIQKLLGQLGSEEFKIREDASEQLLAFGRLALPFLREAVKDSDLEAARRAKMLIERIETRADSGLPIAVLRLLAVRKPAGAAEALLAYLPFVEDETREEEVGKSLVVLLRNDRERGASAPCFIALHRFLTDAQGMVRAVAAEALIEGGGAEGRAAVRKLLREDAPSIRMRLALAMARAGEREGVSVLIELLPLISAEEFGRAEEALHQLAGDAAPEMPKGAESNDKKKCRDAWSVWWKASAGRIDPSRLHANALLGYTIICDNGNNRVFEIDRHGKELWSIGGLHTPTSAVVLAGRRVLIAEHQGNCVSERDFKGKILWQKNINQPLTAQRLPNGHTVITSGDPKGGQVVEVDRAGREVYSIPRLPGGIHAAYRWHQGDIVCTTGDGQCHIFDASGKKRKAFAAGHGNAGYGLDIRSNGHILITRQQTGEVVEFDGEGQLRFSVKTPGVFEASQLPNGHILVACGDPAHVYEVERSGKIIWEYKGNGHFFQARRR